MEISSMCRAMNLHIFLLLISFSFASCSFFSKDVYYPLNNKIGHNLPVTEKVQTLGDGHIVISQKFKTSALCHAFKKQVEINVYNLVSSDQVELVQKCHAKSRALITKSKNTIPKSEYRVSLVYEFNSKVMIDLPRISVHYITPDFASEDDQILEGAVPWEENKKIEGNVNPVIGDKTDSFLLVNLKRANIRFIPKSINDQIKAQLLWVNSDSQKIMKRKNISYSRKVKVDNPAGNDVYMRIGGHKDHPGVAYKLFRKDITVKNRTTVNVIDIHPGKNAETIFVLNLKEGMQENQQVNINIQFEDGKSRKTICKIESQDEQIALCKAKTKLQKSYLKVSAYMFIEGDS
jgi:hypothetical protein